MRKAKVLDKTYQEAAVGAAQYGLGAASVIACFKAADHMKVRDAHGIEKFGCGVINIGRLRSILSTRAACRLAFRNFPPVILCMCFGSLTVSPVILCMCFGSLTASVIALIDWWMRR